jgi:hypothetical protein
MVRAHQICSICSREFTRKSNAERHNENLHASQAHIIPLKEFRFGGLGRHVRNTKMGFSSTTNSHKKEDLLTDVLERIGKEFEGCEHEIMLLPFQDRADILTQVIIFALRSEDPKESMRKFLKSMRRNNLSLKMIHYVATGLDLPYYAAKHLLINTLK